MNPVTLRALMVGDHPGDADLEGKRLSEATGVAFHVSIATSVQTASAQLAEHDFEIVILDLNLPDSSGIETLKRLRALRTATPFVVISSAFEAIRSEALLEGAEEVFAEEEVKSRLFALSLLHLIERYRSEEERRGLLKLLEVSPDAVLVVDGPGRVQYFNDAALALFGRRREDFAQETMAFSAKDGVPVELVIPWSGGERVGEMRLVDFEWRGKRAKFASIRDVTVQKKLEVQLLQSDRLVSIGTLAAGVAHEINNPLTSVIANLDLATERVSELSTTVVTRGDVLEELRDARDAAERVRNIVRDLKIFSRPEDEARHAVDVHRVLESTLRMAWNELRHRAQLVKDYRTQPLPFVDANESRLGQVFLNLIVNAAQAIPEGNVADNEVRIATGVDSAGRVTVTISDTGGGIPPQVQRRLFTPFFTTKPVGQGTGLGLAICQRIVTSLGGEISFESEVGRGARFLVALPALRSDALLPPGTRQDAAVADSRRARVLVVDDESAIVRVVKRILSAEHDVAGTESASQALEMLRRGEEFDVILCDLMMPQVTGMELYEQLREQNREMAARIIFMTGGVFTPSGKAFLDSVPNRHVEKPLDVQGLRAIVRDVVR